VDAEYDRANRALDEFARIREKYVFLGSMDGAAPSAEELFSLSKSELGVCVEYVTSKMAGAGNKPDYVAKIRAAWADHDTSLPQAPAMPVGYVSRAAARAAMGPAPQNQVYGDGRRRPGGGVR
jgi:hypothetical protein